MSYVKIRTLPYPLCFSTNDLADRPLSELAKQMHVSRAFLQLCVEVGCPTINKGLSAGRVLIWLFDHYEQVRAAAGLKPLATVEDLAPAVMAKLRMANALVTLLEYSRMRATDWRQKRQLRRALEQVNILGDRGV